MISTFSAEKHEPTFSMGAIHSTCISPNKSTHEIILSYEIYTHYPDGSTALHDQRLQYSWYKRTVRAKTGSVSHWEIAVPHISNAWTYDSKDTIYQVHYKHLDSPVRLIEKPGHFISVTASNMNVHRIPINCLLYIETIKRTTKLRIHSSYLINPECVSKIERFAVTPSDGTRLPVPEKKYTAIKRQLLSRLQYI